MVTWDPARAEASGMGQRDQMCRIHKLVADVAILAEGQVLLVKYRDTSKYDHQRGWFLPDDFLQYLEHPVEAARRIGMDQAGLELASVDLRDIESFGDGSWHLVFHYVAELEGIPKITPGENVASAEWFRLEAPPDVSEVAHDGWAIEVVQRVIPEARTS
jgi:ADP-ribose pyrophosphatase YjhB (NUDIX family)